MNSPVVAYPFTNYPSSYIVYSWYTLFYSLMQVGLLAVIVLKATKSVEPPGEARQSTMIKSASDVGTI